MLVQKKTISAQVADAIRQKILIGEYEANAQLRQEHLATEFGVSRIPVREALHQLHSSSFMNCAPGSRPGCLPLPSRG